MEEETPPVPLAATQPPDAIPETKKPTAAIDKRSAGRGPDTKPRGGGGICKYFPFGNCHKGKDCKFSHAAPAPPKDKEESGGQEKHPLGESKSANAEPEKVERPKGNVYVQLDIHLCSGDFSRGAICFRPPTSKTARPVRRVNTRTLSSAPAVRLWRLTCRPA